MIQRIQAAGVVMERVPGCLGAECWLEAGGLAVVSIGTWDSEESCKRSFAAVAESKVDFEQDEREERPRAVLRLVSPS